MASSVSSEHAFSSAGITLSKWRNQLKGDIVEALQCLKCMFHNDLIFWDIVVATEEEENLEEMDLELAGGVDDVAEGFTWDQLYLLMIRICTNMQTKTWFDVFTSCKATASA
jgi:hAT family C-terminal dimerisation region